MTYYAEKLADYCVTLDFDDLPSEVIRHARWSVLDAIAVGLASWDNAWSRSVLDTVRRQGGSPEATILHYGDKAPSANAAMANAMFIHSMDFNDDLSGIQVGGIVPPTAIAVGESVGASGKQVITALALVYDVATRIAGAMNSQELYLRGFQPTGVAGPLVAAAVAGKLLNLTSEQIASAFGIAASYAGGTIEFLKDGTDTKRFHVAKAAQGGIISAQLALDGMVGPKSIFEGEHGIIRAFSKEGFPEKLVEQLGRRFDILSTSFKWYPFCDGNACPLEAALAIVRENQIALDSIQNIHFKTKSFLIPYIIDYYGDTARKYRPQNEMDAQMSLPYCLAVGLLKDGDVEIEDFDRSNYHNPEILELADKVTAEGDPELDIVPFLPMSMPAIATVVTKGGKTFSKRVDFQKGDPRNPLTEADFHKKFGRCVKGSLTQEKSDRLLRAINDLEKLSRTSDLTKNFH